MNAEEKAGIIRLVDYCADRVQSKEELRKAVKDILEGNPISFIRMQDSKGGWRNDK